VTLYDGLIWFVWGGLVVGMLIMWAKAMDVATEGGVSAVIRGIASFVLMCSVLAVIVWLDMQQKGVLP
jgi:hypothetical protein